jgi:hypothetical protein
MWVLKNVLRFDAFFPETNRFLRGKIHHYKSVSAGFGSVLNRFFFAISQEGVVIPCCLLV